MQVSSAAIISFVISLFVTLILPIGAIIFLLIKKKMTFIPLILGMAAFVLSQMLLRIPILQALSTQQWFVSLSSNMLFSVVFIGGVTAGLFEESARLGGAKLLRSRRTFKDTISFGIGHGVIEAILIVGIAQINNIVYALAINNGTFEAMTASLPPLTAQSLQINFLSIDPTMVYVGIAERIFAVILHIALTVLVFNGVNRKKIGYYFVAIGVHALVNAGVVLLAQFVNIWVGEAFVALIAVGCILYIFRAKKDFNEHVSVVSKTKVVSSV